MSSDLPENEPKAETLPLAEERVIVGRETTVTGKVRIRTPVEVVRDLVEATLRDERVEVTRVPVDRYVDHAPDARIEGDLTVVPVLEEVLVVERRLVLREELHIRRLSEERSVSVPVERRRQTVVIERDGPSEQPSEKER